MKLAFVNLKLVNYFLSINNCFIDLEEKSKENN